MLEETDEKVECLVEWFLAYGAEAIQDVTEAHNERRSTLACHTHTLFNNHVHLKSVGDLEVRISNHQDAVHFQKTVSRKPIKYLLILLTKVLK